MAFVKREALALRKESILGRSVIFQINPNLEEMKILQMTSDLLWQVREEAYQSFDQEGITRLYQERRKALEAQDSPGAKVLEKRIKQMQESQPDCASLINSIGARRVPGSYLARLNRIFIEQAYIQFDAGYKSYFALLKNGDRDARPPGPKSPHDFCEIIGRRSKEGGCFALKGGKLCIRLGEVAKGQVLDFEVPAYQQGELTQPGAVMKSFTIVRRNMFDPRRPGCFEISVTYDIPRSAPVPFVPEKAVYVALGASFVGIVSPTGEEVIKLRRPDKYWMPQIKELDDLISRCTKGSKMWKKYVAARRLKYACMHSAQKDDRREQVAHELLRHGIHFVVTKLVVRSKQGKLADSSKPERGGTLGLNWQAQNTGAIAYFVQWLEEKAKERGGLVIKHALSGHLPSGQGAENKIPMARLLREDFLAKHMGL